VLSLWHGELVALSLLHRGVGLRPLISWSEDGARLSALLAAWGFAPIRGGSSKGGAAALRSAARALGEGARVVLAVDGPRGPAGVPKPGAAALGHFAPLWAVRCAARPAVRLPTWDRQLIPLPFARLTVDYIAVEGDLAAALGPVGGLSPPSAPAP
jgi:lysophospholipid acyltransferase (LPLAT)-like uncharacterized protein